MGSRAGLLPRPPQPPGVYGVAGAIRFSTFEADLRRVTVPNGHLAAPASFLPRSDGRPAVLGRDLTAGEAFQARRLGDAGELGS
jgi:hypothetical protein